MQRFLACILTVGMSLGCGGSRSPKESAGSGAVELPTVATIRPKRQNILQLSNQPGQIEAFRTTPIFNKVGAYVERLHVDIGDVVQGPKRDDRGKLVAPGQLLATLSAPELVEELQQKQALLSQADAEIEQAEAAVRVARSLLVSANASLDESVAGQQRAEAGLQRWRSENERVKELADTKTITQKLADESEQQLKSAEATQKEAVAKSAASRAKRTEAGVMIDKSLADLKAAQARRDVAQAEQKRVAALLSYLEVRAPYTGVITERNVEEGTLAQPARSGADKPLFVLVAADRVRLFVSVPEIEAPMLAPGRPASVRVPALGAKSFPAVVTRTAWALQADTRNLKCEIDIPNPDGLLRPGMYAQVELTLAQKENALTVPKSAVVVEEGQAICLGVDSQGVLVRKPVRIGIKSTTDLEITEGLAEAESILATNVAAFKPGQKVKNN